MPMATKTSPTGIPSRRVAPEKSTLAARRIPPVVRRSAVLKGSPVGTPRDYLHTARRESPPAARMAAKLTTTMRA